jgi:hypothetical protein
MSPAVPSALGPAEGRPGRQCGKHPDAAQAARGGHTTPGRRNDGINRPGNGTGECDDLPLHLLFHLLLLLSGWPVSSPPAVVICQAGPAPDSSTKGGSLSGREPALTSMPGRQAHGHVRVGAEPDGCGPAGTMDQ